MLSYLKECNASARGTLAKYLIKRMVFVLAGTLFLIVAKAILIQYGRPRHLAVHNRQKQQKNQGNNKNCKCEFQDPSMEHVEKQTLKNTAIHMPSTRCHEMNNELA
jgi:hypothetical protein